MPDSDNIMMICQEDTVTFNVVLLNSILQCMLFTPLFTRILIIDKQTVRGKQTWDRLFLFVFRFST